VYFAAATVERLSADATLPAKLTRLLKRFDLKRLCRGAEVPIKIHLGGGLGYTTLHPLWVRTVADAVRAAGGKPFVVDGSFDAVRTAARRGYTSETLGCPLVAAGGPYGTHVVVRPAAYRTLNEIRVLGAIWDAPCLINLSHAKGHGACGYGGACKNIAMGCVDGATRAKLHALEGGIAWIRERCVFCGRCREACDTGAIEVDPRKRRVSIFFHHCRYCQHCVEACPADALVVQERDGFRHFQEGMALATRTILESFDPARVLHINVLLDITMYCDCWGLSTPSVVPDIGILASHDLVAVETATLRAIRRKHFLPGSLIGRRRLGRGRHLWEKIHGKDPFVQVRALERHGVGSSDYRLATVR
jgi:uncharacterized Fe-S center protein